jgi:hypothetical protein
MTETVSLWEAVLVLFEASLAGSKMAFPPPWHFEFSISFMM